MRGLSGVGAAGRALSALSLTLSLTVCLCATFATASTTRRFFLADAFHHFLARSTCGRGHHVAAGWFAQATPQGLATHGDGLGPLVGCGAKALDLFNLNVLACEFFNFLHKAFLVQGHQTDRFSAGTGAAGSANAVHIVFADIGDFVIHHVRQIVDIDATRCDVGRHQHADLAALKPREGLGACCLALVAVQCHGSDALFVQEVGHMVGTKFGAAKHQHLAPLLGLDDVGQQGFLLLPAHGMHHLFDELHRGVFRRDLNALRFVQQLRRQIADLLAEGGRKQQALLFFGHQGQHFFHVMDKAHVEHAVGLIEHQHLHRGEVQKTLLL